jgi:hypothetical protein
MAVDERDLRMVLVAFEDAVTWCETLAEVTEELIASARDRRQVDHRVLDDASTKLELTRKFLVGDRSEVQRVRQRAGI